VTDQREGIIVVAAPLLGGEKQTQARHPHAVENEIICIPQLNSYLLPYTMRTPPRLLWENNKKLTPPDIENLCQFIALNTQLPIIICPLIIWR